MDFSVTGDGGKILYDLNGNLLSMIQKGVIAGENAPVIVDKLQYGYGSLSNRLTSVTDQTTISNLNGTQGDFKDGSNGSSPDYVYDANSNIVIDLNKDVKDIGGTGNDGIRYNFLDKPEEIRINGKGTIKIVYSADGGKLQRVFIPESGDAKITTYIGEFVYQETDNLSLSTPAPFGSGGELAFIGFEEGRIRVMQPVDEDNGLDQLKIEGNIELPGGRQGTFDYFITDYQANVRMILTEQVHEGLNQCTMETARASQEQSIFGQSGSANEVVQTRFPASSIPQGGWQNQDIGSQVSRLSKSSGKTIGPNAFLKVMAGDEISAFTQYYHQDDANNSTGSNLIEDLVSSLFSVISGSNAASSDVKNGLEGISGQLGNNVPFENIVAPDASNPDGTHPKAYLTILFFDERFRFVEEGSLSMRVEENPGYDDYLSFMNIRAPRNGYAFVYLSNESDEAVYFDNFQVRHNRGRIIEENHYYSFGLRISAISSTKLGDDREGMLNNDYEMQGMFSEMDADIGWNDFALRNYDPQIGRWVQQDPYQQFASPYVGMGNDPANGIDPSGGVYFVDNMMRATISFVGVVSPSTSAATVISKHTLNLSAKLGLIAKGLQLGIALKYNGISFQTNLVGGKPNPVQFGNTYYILRAEDFKKRNPNKPSPTYYLSYGHKYLNRFSTELYPSLSKNGKKWLKQTRRNLQVELERKLLTSTEGDFLENDDEAFTNFAFDTHVKAYVDAGVLKLSVLDKVKIALTPDAEDLFSDGGLRQVVRIGEEQTKYYMENIGFFMEQLFEIYWNKKEINALVKDYYKKHKKFFEDMMKKNPHYWSNPEHKIIGILGHFIYPRFIW